MSNADSTSGVSASYLSIPTALDAMGRSKDQTGLDALWETRLPLGLETLFACISYLDTQVLPVPRKGSQDMVVDVLHPTEMEFWVHLGAVARPPPFPGFSAHKDIIHSSITWRAQSVPVPSALTQILHLTFITSMRSYAVPLLTSTEHDGSSPIW